MADQVALMAKLEHARLAVEAARRKMEPLEDGSLEHMRAQILYLQALVHHTNLLLVMQAEQQRRMAEEIDSLRQQQPPEWRLH